MVGSFIGMILFDRYGRIPIMKIGTIGSIVGLLIASYGLYTHDTGYITIFGILFYAAVCRQLERWRMGTDF